VHTFFGWGGEEEFLMGGFCTGSIFDREGSFQG